MALAAADCTDATLAALSEEVPLADEDLAELVRIEGLLHPQSALTDVHVLGLEVGEWPCVLLNV